MSTRELCDDGRQCSQWLSINEEVVLVCKSKDKVQKCCRRVSAGKLRVVRPLMLTDLHGHTKIPRFFSGDAGGTSGCLDRDVHWKKRMVRRHVKSVEWTEVFKTLSCTERA